MRPGNAKTTRLDNFSAALEVRRLTNILLQMMKMMMMTTMTTTTTTTTMKKKKKKKKRGGGPMVLWLSHLTYLLRHLLGAQISLYESVPSPLDAQLLCLPDAPTITSRP